MLGNDISKMEEGLWKWLKEKIYISEEGAVTKDFNDLDTKTKEEFNKKEFEYKKEFLEEMKATSQDILSKNSNLTDKVNINLQDKTGRSALIYTLEHEFINTKQVETFISKLLKTWPSRLEINLKDKQERSALCIASSLH